ncbi:hypothetical protein H113_01129 [Trichophyton rubrum MR1459]|uniref:Uncharacterized protein n=1 Tax=Trichophyton rubrum (strain ATCC MYA-4607 / CBS 118892) TaxID=559305 RepID=A0A080WLY7_TRIRC|nr:uncharacterized protein TERG_12559 [Trichophyton rubrum CBS 118892]EZF99250.1 hypothetical protein H113_01129 [Trichophyton rubrum MR1459]EZG10214.1 hypothetical protein H106_00926 [Trichophyton rubrum CBS 735.88]KFL62724.1 hypothetical protein TERG_12559 [Trichophyton rubrum CBS 118892]
MVAFAEGLIESCIHSVPEYWPLMATWITVAVFSASDFDFCFLTSESAESAILIPLERIKTAFPMWLVYRWRSGPEVGSTVAETPLPTIASKSTTAPSRGPSSDIPDSDLAFETMVLPIGCSLVISVNPTISHHSWRRHSFVDHVGSILTSATLDFPIVTVPVLSNITCLIFVAASSAAPPLTKIPCSAPTPVPTMTAVGVLRPSAQGHAKTMTDIQIFRHTINVPPLPSTRKILGG